MVSISPSEVPKIFLLPPLDLPPAANLFILQSSNTNGFLLLAALHLSCTLKRNSLEAANLQSSLCMKHSFIRVYPGEKFRWDIRWYNCFFSSGSASDVCMPNWSSSFEQELQLFHLEIHMDPLIWRSKQLSWKILKTMILYIHQHNYIKMIQYCSIIRGFNKVSVLCIFKMGFRDFKMRLQKFTERKKNLVTIYIFLIGHWSSEDNNCFYLQLAVHYNQE